MILRSVPLLHFKIFMKTWHLCVQYNTDRKKRCDCLAKSYHLNKPEGGHKGELLGRMKGS